MSSEGDADAKTGTGRLRTLARLGIVVLLGVGVVVAVFVLQDRNQSEVVVPSVVVFDEADEGSCVNLGEGSGRSQLAVVPCAEPHDAELYEVARTDAGDGAPFPGGEPLLEEAGAVCGERFVEYVGRDYADSALEVVVLVPTPDTWKVGDRSILCLIEDPGVRLVGSVRDIDR